MREKNRRKEAKALTSKMIILVVFDIFPQISQIILESPDSCLSKLLSTILVHPHSKLNLRVREHSRVSVPRDMS